MNVEEDSRTGERGRGLIGNVEVGVKWARDLALLINN